MFKQSLALELMLKNEKMDKGFDFSFKQYIEQLKTHISSDIDKNFKDLFAKKFYSRYNSVDTIMDEFDTFFAMFETDCEIILPLYEKRFLAIKSLEFEDLKDSSILESETSSSSQEKSSAKSKSFGSSFPSEMINHDSLEYATDGTHSSSEGTGTGTSTSKSKTTNVVGSRVDRMEKYLNLQLNVINDCVNEFKHLFVMIY